MQELILQLKLNLQMPSIIMAIMHQIVFSAAPAYILKVVYNYKQTVEHLRKNAELAGQDRGLDYYKAPVCNHF